MTYLRAEDQPRNRPRISPNRLRDIQDEAERLQWLVASLLLLPGVLDNEAGKAFVQVLGTVLERSRDATETTLAYGRWFRALAAVGQSWPDYLLDRLVALDAPTVQKLQGKAIADLPDPTIEALKRDLQALQQLWQFEPATACQWARDLAGGAIDLVPWTLPAAPSAEVPPESSSESGPESSSESGLTAKQKLLDRLRQVPDWTTLTADLVSYFSEVERGPFVESRAFRWRNGQLLPVTSPDLIALGDLAGYDGPKADLVRNTEFLLAGQRALNVLLYGARGTGKSSLVKALLSAYGDRGLRLVEVAKQDLNELPEIVDQLRSAPQKFILFVDDLSFEEDDEAFKALKVCLEGGITDRPKNVVVYATSNRRHLVREYFADRPRPSDADEIQSWDTVQEKLSFVDRFGLTLTFEAADQPTYLDIVFHLAELAELAIDRAELRSRALQWATRHNGRSGRTARQFIDFITAEQALAPVAPTGSPTES
ncbi:MAG: ATP-binding protein [Oscillatoriales cyanobacterium]|nr:MAG: ATP-binding protein [Oscillatoriales cyanobacterium]